jgi:hypothetical protein
LSGTATTLSGLLGTVPSTFPGWQNPSASVYTFTVQSSGGFLDISAIFQNFGTHIASMLMQLIAWVMYLAILVVSKFSNPSWVINPVAQRLDTIFKQGYSNVFLRMLPFLVLAVAVYIVWQYLRAKHAKILTAIFSTFLSGGLIYAFFFNFGWVFTSLNNLAQIATDELGAAVASTVSTKPGSMYDELWNLYVVEPWEVGQFGHASANLHDFDVSADAQGQTYKNDNGDQVQIKAGDNWVQLFMRNVTGDARQSLLSIVTNVTHPFAQQSWTNADVQNAAPYNNIIFYVAFFILMLPVVVFLGFMGFILFAQSAMFVYLVLMGIVTVPIAFVPEVGWTVTLRWFREAVGYLLLKMANVVYMATAFALAGLVTQAFSASGTVQSLMNAALADALIFLAALVFRERVMHLYVRPHIEMLQGIAKKKNEKEDGTSSQEEGEASSNTSAGSRTGDTSGAQRGRARRTGTLDARFRAVPGGLTRVASVVDTAAQMRNAAAAAAEDRSSRGADKGVRARLAAAFNREAVKEWAKDKAAQAQEWARDKAAQAMDSVLNPERTTWQERTQRRADRLISLERAAHRVALRTTWKTGDLTYQAMRKTGELTYQAGVALWDRFRPDDIDNHNNDDNPPYDDNNDNGGNGGNDNNNPLNNGGNNNDNPPYPPYASGGISNARASQPNTCHEEDDTSPLTERFAEPVQESAQENEPDSAGVRRNIESERASDAPTEDNPASSGTELTNRDNRVTVQRPGVPQSAVSRDSEQEEAESARVSDAFAAPAAEGTSNNVQNDAEQGVPTTLRNEAPASEVKRADTVSDDGQHRLRREPLRRSVDEQSRAEQPDKTRMADGFTSAMTEDVSSGGSSATGNKADAPARSVDSRS